MNIIIILMVIAEFIIVFKGYHIFLFAYAGLR